MRQPHLIDTDKYVFLSGKGYAAHRFIVDLYAGKCKWKTTGILYIDNVEKNVEEMKKLAEYHEIPFLGYFYTEFNEICDYGREGASTPEDIRFNEEEKETMEKEFKFMNEKFRSESTGPIFAYPSTSPPKFKVEDQYDELDVDKFVKNPDKYYKEILKFVECK